MYNHHRSHFVVCAYPPKPLRLAGDTDSAFDTAICTSISRQTSAARHILSIAVNMKSEASARWRWPLRADDWQSTPTAGCVTANHLLAGGATPPCQHLHASFCSLSARHLLLERYSRHLPRPSGWRRFPHQRARIFPHLWISIADGSSHETLTYLSAAPRTSSTRDTLRRV